MTRWSEERSELSMPAELPGGLNQSQLQSFLLQVRLEEIARRLKSSYLEPSKYTRNSPTGQTLSILLDERAKLIEDALKTNPALMTPIDFTNHIRDNREKGMVAVSGIDLSNLTPSVLAILNSGGIKKIGNKFAEKIWIPQRDFPDVNFIGLLIGPRGNTLKKMEAESGAKISIRGKGSLKEGKNDPASLAAAEEELHTLIMGDSSDKVSKASRLINKIIETAASTPEAAHEMKRLQLRELAALNGTLRIEESVVCANCGQTGHRRFECLERRSVTATTMCKICGGFGHLASDCVHKNDPEMVRQSEQRNLKIETEYQSFMKEITATNSPNNQTTHSAGISSYSANFADQDQTNLSHVQNFVMDPVQLQQYYSNLMMNWNPNSDPNQPANFPPFQYGQYQPYQDHQQPYQDHQQLQSQPLPNEQTNNNYQ